MFFRPDDSFLVWLKEYAGERPVFDVGCGSGHFLKRMWANDIKAMGVDLFADQIEDHDVRRVTLCDNAVSCPTLKRHKGLVLFCRPSHSGWVGQTIRSNIHPDAEVLYISRPGNVCVDLIDFCVSPVEAPGLFTEEVWRVERPFPEKEKS